jgi:hypothetical protein
MICVEDIGHLLPSHRSGKIVGVASYRGDYIIVACEHGLYRLWDDGTGDMRATPTQEPQTGDRNG